MQTTNFGPNSQPPMPRPEWPPLDDPGYDRANQSILGAPQDRDQRPPMADHYNPSQGPVGSFEHDEEVGIQLTPPKPEPIKEYIERRFGPALDNGLDRWDDVRDRYDGLSASNKTNVKMAGLLGLVSVGLVLGGIARHYDTEQTSIEQDGSSHVSQQAREELHDAWQDDTSEDKPAFGEVVDMFYELSGNKGGSGQSPADLLVEVDKVAGPLAQSRSQAVEAGAQNPIEVLTNSGVDPQQLVDLFMSSDREARVSRERMALVLAHIAKEHPETTDYIKAEIKAARLQATIDAELEKKADATGRAVDSRRASLQKLHDSIEAQINAPR